MVANDKILFIMGNGPSLGEVMNDPKKLQVLRDNHTFGLNAAYRAYEKYNFYPTYFGCFDYVVNESHKEAFENLVLSDNPIQEFYFTGNKEKQNLYSETVRNNSKFIKFNFHTFHPNCFFQHKNLTTDFSNYFDPGSSGANATQIGIMKGYKKIVLLGCDCNYVEKIDGVESFSNEHKSGIELTKNLETNPNYWFSEYQQKGDRFNLPSADEWQILSWRNISKIKPADVEIINNSLISRISYFEKKVVV
jgi:hypothetical protein